MDDTPLSQIKYVRDLTEGQRADLEDYIDDGMKPSEIRNKTGIPINVIQIFSRDYKRKLRAENLEELHTSTSVSTAKVPSALNFSESTDTLKQVMNLRKDQLAMELLQEQIDQMRDDATHRREMRKLELEAKALEIEERRADLYSEGEEEEIGTQAPPDAVFPNAANSEYGWIIDILNFAKTVQAKPAKTQQPVQVQTMTQAEPDFTKPLSPLQIQEEIKKFPPEQIKLAAAFPDKVAEGLKSKYPGILPENINTINAEIKRYVNNP